MSEPKNKKALETGSGIAWQAWLEFLQPYRELDHTEMAKVAYKEIVRRGKSKSPEWWAQGATVAYEQHIGRRQVGQTCDGNFSVTVSRTVEADMDNALATWSETCEPLTSFNGVKITSIKRISQTEKWRYWRCDLEDGSKVSVNIQTKPAGNKSTLAINHDKLSSATDVDHWRTFWRDFSLADK
jgi:hypothetical protein